VLNGTWHVRYADGSAEAITPGERYYLPGGHTVWFTEDTTFIECSPAESLQHVMNHAAATMARSG
jgi:hypothetical protein